MLSATLVDTSAFPRVVLSSHPFDGRFAGHMMDVRVAGPAYQVNERTLTHSFRVAEWIALFVALMDDLHGRGEFVVWGIGEYRIEGSLLRCQLAGDGRGHFAVDLSLAQGHLRLSDRFTTDQTCLALFIAELRRMGEAMGDDATPKT